jgi:hypothetical protein
MYTHNICRQIWNIENIHRQRINCKIQSRAKTADNSVFEQLFIFCSKLKYQIFHKQNIFILNRVKSKISDYKSTINFSINSNNANQGLQTFF